MRRVLVAVLVAFATALTVLPAQAADPGRWQQTGMNPIPLYDYQGITSDPAGKHLWFDGVDFGLYRTDAQLHEQARNDDVIPLLVTLRTLYNHIGDISYDRAGGGRILLPLECYYEQLGNLCGTGAIGVADPQTLRWRYYVELDPRFIPKAMWCEVSPDGTLLWTSSGSDLIAYSVADINPHNAAPAGPKLVPVRRLPGAVPPSGITGAAFYQGRLLLAGSDAAGFEVYSIDLTTGQRRLEIQKQIVGESEGLDVSAILGGLLHWQIQPANNAGLPTYGIIHGELLTFRPTAS